jgi:predicted acylesterase/phospholipase RssA
MSEQRPEELQLALCLSGGGFRATFFHLGVLRCLHDVGLLPKLKVVCSVSGGSILAAHLAVNWDKYAVGSNGGFDAAAESLIRFARIDLRGRIVRRWLLMRFLTLWIWSPSATKMTSLLQAHYTRLFGSADVKSLGPTPEQPGRPQFHLLATSMTTGDLCSFTDDGLWTDSDNEVRHLPNRLLPISLAVAASSAFPPLFPPVEVTRTMLDASIAQFPHDKDYLTGGGVYDNLGIRKLLRLVIQKGKSFGLEVVSDASGGFDWKTGSSFSFIISRTVRGVMVESGVRVRQGFEGGGGLAENVACLE